LPQLFEKFVALKELADKNPGDWIEGNIVLGAKEKEYRPSEYELLLDETGSRIEHIIESNSMEIIQGYRLMNSMEPVVLKFEHFLFIHVDVMGSGRFFYVNDIISKEIVIE